MIVIFSGQPLWPELIENTGFEIQVIKDEKELTGDLLDNKKPLWMPADIVKKACETAKNAKETVFLTSLSYPEKMTENDRYRKNLETEMQRFLKDTRPDNIMAIQDFEYTKDETKIATLKNMILGTNRCIGNLETAVRFCMNTEIITCDNNYIICRNDKNEDPVKMTPQEFAWKCAFNPMNMHDIMMQILPRVDLKDVIKTAAYDCQKGGIS